MQAGIEKKQMDPKTAATLLDAAAEKPETFDLYADIIMSGDKDLIELTHAALERLLSGVADGNYQGANADIQNMLDDFRAKKKGAEHE